MSDQHKDRIMAAMRQLSTDRGQAYAFSYLTGILSVVAEVGKPASAAKLAEAFETAVEYVIEKDLDRELR